jgi:uncharacterized protein (UPF0332 family)
VILETNRFLAKARKLLEHATTMFSVSLNEDAGRTTYRARFHAAQAFIFETTEKVFKSRKGVQTKFLRLPTTIRAAQPIKGFFCLKNTISKP